MKSFETTIKPLLKYGDGVAKETGKKFKEFGCTKVLAGYDANLPESVVSTVLDSITAEGIELIPYSCPYADGQDTGVLEVRQLAETPDGVRYLCLAREISASGVAFRAPVRRFAIALGCEISHAAEVVYSDGLDLKDAEAFEPIGISCRICERRDCHQRSVPPLESRLSVDPNRRETLPYEVVG